jgi:hypothetical protein
VVHLKIMKMQSFITRGPKNKYCLYVVLTPNKIRPINIFQETKYTLNNENNENTVILENCREKIKFGLITTMKYMLQNLIVY